MNTCASVAALSALKLDCDPELIRAIWKAESRRALEAIYPDAAGLDSQFFRPYKLRELKRHAISKAAGFYGLEYLGDNKRSGVSVYYCNAGDTYAATICFCGSRLFVESWGDMIEAGTIREAVQL